MDIFNTLANITRPAQSNNSNMNFIVTIKSKSPSIGAKERKAEFTDREDAKQQFDRWAVWLGAEVNYDECDLVQWVAESDNYLLKMERINPPKTNIDIIDYDTRN